MEIVVSIPMGANEEGYIEGAEEQFRVAQAIL